MAAGPLLRWDQLAAWAEPTSAKRGRWDLALGWQLDQGAEARARVAYGLTTNIDAAAEAWARWNRSWETGAMLGLTGRW